MTITPAFKLVCKYYTHSGVLDTTLTLPMFNDPLACGAEPDYMTADRAVCLYIEDDDIDCQGLPTGMADVELSDPQGFLLWSNELGWVD